MHANASRHSALPYGHAEKLEAQLPAEVAELLARAEAADAEPLPEGWNLMLLGRYRTNVATCLEADIDPLIATGRESHPLPWQGSQGQGVALLGAPRMQHFGEPPPLCESQAHPRDGGGIAMAHHGTPPPRPPGRARPGARYREIGYPNSEHPRPQCVGGRTLAKPKP